MRRVLRLAAAGFLTLAVAACVPPGHAGHGREHRYAYRLLHHDATQMGCLDSLWDQESDWDPYAVNGQTGAYGIPQALPSAHGHPFALGDWRAQIRWGLRYIEERYGSACAAESHEQRENWY